MDIDLTAKAMQYILAPVVMVSACGLVLNGMQARYTTINSRLREMARERLQLLSNETDHSFYKKERLHEIDYQLPKLSQHHVQAHHAILTLYASIILFVMNMFAIALAYATGSSTIATGALLFFLIATGTFLTSLVINARDFRLSHCSAQYEVKRVLAQCEKLL